MTVVPAVDLISDLNIEPDQDFDWTGKATSLFCAVAGNVSSDLPTVGRVLRHLSKCYQGLIYIDGALEHQNSYDYDSTIEKLKIICSAIPRVIYLHNNVVVTNGIAFMAANGWSNTDVYQDQTLTLRMEDIGYLTNTIKKLQIHSEVKKIIMITGASPSSYITNNYTPGNLVDKFEPALCLIADTENKVSAWLFGGESIAIDVVHNNRHFVNNTHISSDVYWPRRVEL